MPKPKTDNKVKLFVTVFALSHPKIPLFTLSDNLVRNK